MIEGDSPCCNSVCVLGICEYGQLSSSKTPKTSALTCEHLKVQSDKTEVKYCWLLKP